MLDAISLECSNRGEIQQVKQELSKFKREAHEPFATNVNKFDSIYSHFVLFKAPINGKELARLSIPTLKLITPHLVSPGISTSVEDKCSKKNLLVIAIMQVKI